MEERDPPPSRAAPRGLIHQPVAGLAARSQGRVQIGNPVAEMVNAGAAPGQESRHRAVGIMGSEQLDVALPEGERYDRGAIGGFGRAGRDPEDLAVKGQGLLEVGYGYSHVGQARLVGC